MVQITHIIAAVVLKALTSTPAAAEAAIAASRLRYIWPADLSIPAALIEESQSSINRWPAPDGLGALDKSVQNAPGRLQNSNKGFVREEVIPNGIDIDNDQIIHQRHTEGEESMEEFEIHDRSHEEVPITTSTISTSSSSQQSSLGAGYGSNVPPSGWIILSGAVAAPTVLLSALAVKVLKQHKLIQTKVLMSSYSLDENVSLSENEDDEGPLRFQLVRDDAEDWESRPPSYLTPQHH